MRLTWSFSYPFAVKGVDMKAGIGIVPWNAYGTYGIDRDFYVQNVFLNAGKAGRWPVRSSWDFLPRSVGILPWKMLILWEAYP